MRPENQTTKRKNRIATSMTWRSPKRNQARNNRQQFIPMKRSCAITGNRYVYQGCCKKLWAYRPSAGAYVHAKTRRPQRRKRCNSAFVGRVHYAGPIFNEAPNPSALPVPAFTMQRRRTSSFDIQQLASPAGQEGKRLLPWSTPQTRHSFPSKMTTAHDVDTDRYLLEIQQKLRSVLKLGLAP